MQAAHRIQRIPVLKLSVERGKIDCQYVCTYICAHLYLYACAFI